ncbi:hypothetical protein [Lysobacter gummosus]|uniref:hypothetical protein n=1 Tax=Lysobacter gummosus TaxID=262324 RepID=UPI003641CC51
MAPNGALRVPRSLSWMFMPAAPVMYQRSSKSCALATCAMLRPPSKAAQRSFLFIVVAPGSKNMETASARFLPFRTAAWMTPSSERLGLPT